MSKVSINNLTQYAKNMDARPLPSDMFEVRITRSQLQWLTRLVAVQVKTERAQLDYYIKRDAAKHPERKTIDRFQERLGNAKGAQYALDKARRIEQ